MQATSSLQQSPQRSARVEGEGAAIRRADGSAARQSSQFNLGYGS